MTHHQQNATEAHTLQNNAKCTLSMVAKDVKTLEFSVKYYKESVLLVDGDFIFLLLWVLIEDT